MEQRSKRRRLSQKEETLIAYFEPENGPWPRLHHGIVVEEGSRRHQERLRKGTPQPLRISSDSSLPLNKSRSSRYAATHGDSSLSKVLPRGLGEDRSPEPPLKTAIASMVQLVVDLPKKPLTKLLIPPASSIIPLEGYGTLTLDTGPSSSPLLPSQTDSAIISSSAYPASSSMRSANLSVHSASSAQQHSSSQAGRGSVLEISKTVDEPAYSITVAKTSPSSSTSLKINVPRPDSQVVLISPPSTPIPSNLPSSVLPDNTGSSHLTLPVISLSSSHATQSSLPLTSSLQPSKPKNSIASATDDASSTIPSSKPGTISTDKSTHYSRRSNTATKSTSTTTHLSATKRPTTSATSLSSIRSKSHTSFKTSRTKSSASSSITSSSKLQSLTSSSLIPTTSTDAGVITGGGGGEAGAGSGEPAGTINASPPSETPQSGGGSGGSSTRVASPTVIGGVVGGVAGLTIFCLVAFLLLYRRRNRQRRNISSQPQATTPLPPGSSGQDMTTTERSSTAPLAAAAFLKRLRPQSGQTAATTDTTPSERGFQNLGGRKLESVLSSRGDGYSEPGASPGMVAASTFGVGASSSPRRPPGFGHSPGPSEPESISRSSFYRDSQGFHGGNDGDPPSSSNLRAGSNPTSMAAYPIPPESGLPPEGIAGFGSGDTEIAIMRPSPARTPVTGGFAPPPPRSPRNIPSPRSPGTPISRGHRDGLGRSHPSFDGSRGSRFTEDM